MPRSDAPAGRGQRLAPDLTAQAHAIYRSLTGEDCAAIVLRSARMRARTAGHYRCADGKHLIVLSARYLEQASSAQREDLLRHELAHYHLAEKGHPRAGHGPLFRALQREWGFERFPDRELMRRIAAASPRLRHLYLCPAGHEHWLTRHPGRKAVSCAICAQRYDRRHRLRYSGTSARR